MLLSILKIKVLKKNNCNVVVLTTSQRHRTFFMLNFNVNVLTYQKFIREFFFFEFFYESILVKQ